MSENPTHRELVDIINLISDLAIAGKWDVIEDLLVDSLELDLTRMMCYLRGAFVFRSKLLHYDLIIGLAAVEIWLQGRNHETLLAGLLKP